MTWRCSFIFQILLLLNVDCSLAQRKDFLSNDKKVSTPHTKTQKRFLRRMLLEHDDEKTTNNQLFDSHFVSFTTKREKTSQSLLYKRFTSSKRVSLLPSLFPSSFPKQNEPLLSKRRARLKGENVIFGGSVSHDGSSTHKPPKNVVKNSDTHDSFFGFTHWIGPKMSMKGMFNSKMDKSKHAKNPKRTRTPKMVPKPTKPPHVARPAVSPKPSQQRSSYPTLMTLQPTVTLPPTGSANPVTENTLTPTILDTHQPSTSNRVPTKNSTSNPTTLTPSINLIQAPTTLPTAIVAAPMLLPTVVAAPTSSPSANAAAPTILPTINAAAPTILPTIDLGVLTILPTANAGVPTILPNANGSSPPTGTGQISFSITYILPPTVGPVSAADKQAAENIVTAFVEDQIKASFDLNEFVIYNSITVTSVGNKNETTSSFNFDASFTPDSVIVPSNTDLYTLISTAFSIPEVNVLLAQLNALPASNPISQVTAINYEASSFAPPIFKLKMDFVGNQTILPPNLNASSMVSYTSSRCFTTTQELREAVALYLINSDPDTQCAQKYGWPISEWCVDQLEDLSFVFAGAKHFNEPLDRWKVSKVNTIQGIFYQAKSFNQDLSTWDTRQVSNMGAAFFDATAFNGNVAKWNTSQVTDMSFMFARATNFNTDISGWDTSKVTDMTSMFQEAKIFNQNIQKWDVSAMTNLDRSFKNATMFRQNLCHWIPDLVGRNVSVVNMLVGSRCEDTNDWSKNIENTMNISFCTLCSEKETLTTKQRFVRADV